MTNIETTNEQPTETKSTKIIFGKGKDVEWSDVESIYEGMGKLTSGSNITPILKRMRKLVNKHL